MKKAVVCASDPHRFNGFFLTSLWFTVKNLSMVPYMVHAVEKWPSRATWLLTHHLEEKGLNINKKYS